MTSIEPQAAPLHLTVMPAEVLAALAPRDGGIYVDSTFGAGGITTSLLESADCRVFALDRDPEAIALGQDLAKRYPQRLTLILGRFSQMDMLIAPDGTLKVNGITFDLGVSSPQIDQPARGFSFRADGPLDMRMAGSAGEDGQTAADLVNNLPEGELARLIWTYGEERRARQIARAIATARRAKPITRTLELAEIVRKVVRRSPDGIDPATRTFQALRIAVNEEDRELDRGLAAAERLLAPGGRLAVIAFHSLEDRAVKRFFSQRCGTAGRGSRHRPTAPEAPPAASFKLLFRGAKRPGETEARANPRARSARLRAAERTTAPAWPDDFPGGLA